MAVAPLVARVAPGMFSVDVEGRREIVYVAGPPDDRWAFWNGRVFHSGDAGKQAAAGGPPPRGQVPQSLTAPMPASVIRVLVSPGSAIKKGEVVVLLEAMKMELPVRALSDGVVRAVHCRDGELVQADQVLVETE